MKQTELQEFMLDNKVLILQMRQAAHELHASVNQTYDDVHPYGFHLDMVADNTANHAHHCITSAADILPVVFGAYFHDSIEDARQSYNDVLRLASQWLGDAQARMATEIVYALTNDKGRTRAERAGERYYAGIRATPYAPLVKLADRLANTLYSARQQSPRQARMLEIYRAEMPHFLQALTVTSTDDPRLMIPPEMEALLRRISQS